MAQPTSLNSPTPCEDLVENAPQWDGPKYHRICTDGVGNRTYILNEVIIPETNNCPIEIYPCVFMCGDDE